MSFFESISQLPDDPILGLKKLYLSDPREKKIDLSIGAYKNAEGNPQVLSSVRKAEQFLLDRELDKEYAPISGLPEYAVEVEKLIFGENSDRTTITQTIGATGALRIGGEFLARNRLSEKIYLSEPTWPNHKAIFSYAGLEIDSYPYYDDKQHKLNFESLCASIQEMPPGSVILLQPCCHNPTGEDPTFQQWQQISTLIKNQGVIPFFDFPYQGFGEDIEEDAQVVRYFMEKGHEFLLAYSFSKNLGLYGERVGALAIVTNHSATASKVRSQIRQMVRANYSTPPLHGAHIAATILKNSDLRSEWIDELVRMRNRVKEMRNTLASGFKSPEGDDPYAFFSRQQGLFSLTGLNPEQVQRLKDEHGVYLIKNGRINFAGVNANNIEHLINAITAVTR